MKKIIIILIIATLVLTGCGNKQATNEYKIAKEIILTNSEINDAISGARGWAKKHKNKMPNDNTREICLPIQQLFDEKYISLENYKSYDKVKITGSIYIWYNSNEQIYEYDYSPDNCE